MSNEYALTKNWWTVHTGNDESSIAYGSRGESTRVCTPHTSFAEFDTEEELASYLGELTGVSTWYADQQPKEEGLQ